MRVFHEYNFQINEYGFRNFLISINAALMIIIKSILSLMILIVEKHCLPLSKVRSRPYNLAPLNLMVSMKARKISSV